MDNLNVFVDESGQTGANYLDKEQPFYIVGGWSEKKSSKYGDVVEYIKSIKGQNRELKSTTLTKNTRGKQRLIKILTKLLKLEYIPVMCIVEKKIAVIGKMIDELLDPQFNDKIPTSFTRDETEEYTKIDISTILYNLSDEIVESFAKVIQNVPNEKNERYFNEVCEVIDNISKELIELGEISLSEKFKNSKIKIKENPFFYDERFEWCGDEETISISRKVAESINFFSFNSLIHIIEVMSQENKAQYKIIHDEQRMYWKAYDMILKMTKYEEDYYTSFQNRELIITSNNVESVEFRNSVEIEFIQLADLLVGGLNYIMKKKCKNKKLDKEDQELLRIYSGIVSNKRMHLMISKRMAKKIFGFIYN